MVSGIPHFKNKVMAREKVSNMKTKDCRTIRINVRNGSINMRRLNNNDNRPDETSD